MTVGAPQADSADATSPALAPTLVALVMLGVSSGALASVTIVNNRPGVFIDIKDTGTSTKLGADNSLLINTSVGNSIFPAGKVVISNNGGIGFNPTSSFLDPVPEVLPSAKCFGGSKAILPYWSDIGNHVGDVYYQEVGSNLIVQWDNKRFEDFPDSGAVTFQVQIRSNVVDDIVAQILYQSITESPAFGGANGAVGYQDGVGGDQNDFLYTIGTRDSLANLEILTVLAPSPGTGCLVLVGVAALSRRRRA